MANKLGSRGGGGSFPTLMFILRGDIARNLVLKTFMRAGGDDGTTQ